MSVVMGDAASNEHISLCEALDKLLHKGVVLRAEVKLCVADIDLVYLGLQVLLASTETARRYFEVTPTPVVTEPAAPTPVVTEPAARAALPAAASPLNDGARA